MGKTKKLSLKVRKEVIILKIGLWSDSHNFPSLPLMKLSAYHKSHGDLVEFLHFNELKSGQMVSDFYNKVYFSKVFTESVEPVGTILCANIEKGGSGYDLENQLPDYIEKIFPDYSLYPEYDFAVGFLTRGCPRTNHTYCITPKKDGTCVRKVADLVNFWNGQKEIKLLDQNLLAYRGHMELLKQLYDSGAWVDFIGGMDARFTNEENLVLLSKMKVKAHHFAWDDPREDLRYKFIRIREVLPQNERNMGVYVLTNYWSTHEEDLFRVYWLRDNGFTPYVMVYDKQKYVTEKGKLKKDVREKFTPEQIHHFKICQLIQRWCNSRYVFRQCLDFYEYHGYRQYMKKEGVI